MMLIGGNTEKSFGKGQQRSSTLLPFRGASPNVLFVPLVGPDPTPVFSCDESSSCSCCDSIQLCVL